MSELQLVAWMRKWAFDGEEPYKEKRENGRLAWPRKFKLLPVTQNKCLDDDVPLYASPVVPEGWQMVPKEAIMDAVRKYGSTMTNAEILAEYKP